MGTVSLLFLLCAGQGSGDTVGGYSEPYWEHPALDHPQTQTSVADLNGDGVEDWIIHWPMSLETSQSGFDWVRAVDGSNGETIWTWSDSFFSEFPKVNLALGDFDGDGRPEIALGAKPKYASEGVVVVLNGEDGVPRWRRAGVLIGTKVDSMTAVADVDGDGCEDLLNLSPGWNNAQQARMTLFSGASGNPLWFRDENGMERIGDTPLLSLWDVDHDGRDEVFLHSPVAGPGTTESQLGVVARVDPSNGQFFWLETGPWSKVGMGSELQFVDFNGDGIEEVVVLSDSDPGKRTTVRVFDALSGILKWTAMEGVRMGYRPVKSWYGDLTGDGFPDAIFAAQDAEVEIAGVRTPEVGSVRAYNGLTGNRLWGIDGSEYRHRLGSSVHAIRGPGGNYPAILIEDQSENPLVERAQGSLKLLDGSSGSLIWEYRPDVFTYPFEGRVWIADLNGDGIDDPVVASMGAQSPSGVFSGVVTAIDGRDGMPMWSQHGVQANSEFGSEILLTDLDHDSLVDVVVGEPDLDRDDLSGFDHGRVAAYSGRDGREFWSLFGDSYVGDVGRVLHARDFNGDGIDEILSVHTVDHEPPSWSIGMLLMLDGASGKALWEMGREHPRVKLVDFDGPDLDGDHLPELVLRDSRRIFTVDGRSGGWKPGLALSAENISVAHGGRIGAFIDLSEAFGNSEYRLLASLSGTGPTWVGDLAVPLSHDLAFTLSWLGRYPHGMVDQPFGFLDDRGDTLLTLTFWPGRVPAAMVGQSLSLAAVSRQGPLTWEISTAAAAILFLP